MKRRLQMLALWAVCVGGTCLTLLLMLGKVFTNPDKAREIAAALDRAGNVSVNGNKNETISSRAHRAMNEGKLWGCILCKLLDKIERDHCSKSAGV